MGYRLEKKNQLAHLTKVWIGIRPRRGAGVGRGEKCRGVGRVGMIIKVDVILLPAQQSLRIVLHNYKKFILLMQRCTKSSSSF